MPGKRGDGRIYQRNEVWWIEYWQNNKQYRESTGLRGKRNEGAARKILRAKTGEIAQGTFQAEAKITIDQILNDFEKDYRIRGGRQLRKLQSHLKPVREHLGHLKVQDLTERRIRDYVDKRLATITRLGKPTSQATVNRELQPLGQALRLAHKDRLIKRVPNIRLFPETTVRQGFFEYQEVAAIVSHLPDYLKDFVWFGYYSGWRKNEIARLEWQDVDIPARIIRLRPENSKNAEGRLLTLEGPLWIVIGNRVEVLTGPFVFHRDGKSIGDFRKAWRSACKKAGVTRIFHDFRRTAVRDMVRAGVPERVAMAISGHKTRSIFDRYNIVSDQDLRDAVQKTHSFRTSRTKPAQEEFRGEHEPL